MATLRTIQGSRYNFPIETNMKISKVSKGMSLFELLIIIALFLVVTSIAGQGLFVTIKGSSKSKTTTKVKQDANYVVSILERSVHSASAFVTSTNSSISFRDEVGNPVSFSCIVASSGLNGAITQNTTSLISSSSKVDICTVSCQPAGGFQTCSLNLTLSQTGDDTGLRAEEKARISITTQVRFRN